MLFTTGLGKSSSQAGKEQGVACRNIAVRSCAHLKTVRAFVDKVANKHQFVSTPVIFDFLQELGQLNRTAMYVANYDKASILKWVKM